MIPRPPALDATQAEQLLQILIGIVADHLRTGSDERIFAPVTLLNASRLMQVPEYAQSPRVFAMLGMLHWIRHRANGSDADLDAARRFFSHVYPIDPSVLPDELRGEFAGRAPTASPLCEVWHSHGATLAEEWRRDGGERLLDHAIIAFGMSLVNAPQASSHLSSMEYNLGISLCARFHLLREREDLDAGVAALQRAGQTIADGDPNRQLVWNALGDALATRFLSTRALSDVDAAVAAYRVAGRAALFALGSALWSRFELTGSAETMAEAIEVFRAIIQRTDSSDPPRPRSLSALSHALIARYRMNGDPADLDTALGVAEMALAETRAGDELRGSLAHNVAAIREIHARARQE